jgi:hypothetical protein
VELYEGLYLKTGSLTVLDGGDPLFTLENGDINKFAKDGIDFVAALTEDKAEYTAASPYPLSDGATFVGTVTGESALFLGRLQHSIFGWWTHDDLLAGTATAANGKKTYLDGAKDDGDSPSYTEDLVGAFYAGDSNSHKAPASNIAFTGIATAGVYHNYDPQVDGLDVFVTDKRAALLGTATMPAKAGAMPDTLKLEFADFYNFEAAINIDGSGAISGAFTGITDHGGNTTGITMDTNIDNYAQGHAVNLVNGQFYGDSAATEAAGVFHLYKEDGPYDTGIFGAFGVKQ